jgi:hypothetical protein
MSKGDRIRGENQFINREATGEVADKIAARVKEVISDPRYEAAGKVLSLRWAPTTKFDADARIDEEGHHQISISYGAAYETYRDAFVLPQVCRRTLTEAFYDPLYDLLSYGNDRQDVLPAGLAPDVARTEGIMMGIGWLYCHEQAHLFQAHGDIARLVGAGVLDTSGALAEAESPDLLEDRDAAVRHVFELCADHEATFIGLKDLTKAGQPIEQKDLWLFVVTLCCMFQRMGVIERPMPDLAHGSHPHPAFRMRMAVRQIKTYLRDPVTISQMQAALNPVAVDLLLDHAVTTAVVYWHMRYRDQDSFPPFIRLVLDDNPVPASYRDQIFNTWSELDPEMACRYMGWGPRYRIRLTGPQDLS